VSGDIFMIIIHDFKIDIEEYVSRGKDNDFPVISGCPCCSARRTLHRHGFYERNGLSKEKEYRLVICRLRCPSCDQTFSIIPDFLLPYYQHTLTSVISGITKSLASKHAKGTFSRQLLSFYRQRFLASLTWIHSFFADLGGILSIAEKEIDKAYLYLDKIKEFGPSRFLRKSFNHLSGYFMCKFIQWKIM